MWHRRSGAEKAKDVAHLATYYWSRLIATAGCWFFWDFGFYGNKVFQSQFVSILTGGSASADPPIRGYDPQPTPQSSPIHFGYWLTMACCVSYGCESPL